ncbi:MAG: caspase family protein, partial [Chitinophagaceae bacterium]
MKISTFRFLLRGACVLLLAAAAATAGAQEQRALVIGIDIYQPPDGVTPANDGGRIDFPDLDGCKNDAQSMKSLITRYNFAEANVRELYDRAATRDAILAGMNALLADSKRGDLALIYYAGHGSQMRNSVGGEDDGRDESVVPSNTWEKGVSDIRDKELARVFNQFIDKGVKLTVIFDCCHSGSMSRGNPVYKVKSRYIAESNFDVKDASRPVPPENRPNSDFLILSAAQDNEFAQEQMGNDNMPHGAFTVALLQAIQLHSINVPVTTLFQSLREILKSNGKRQEPVLTGSLERQRQNLFGVTPSKLSDDVVVPASLAPSGRVTLRGGVALGLGIGNELVKVNNENVRLRIVKLSGMGESEAEIVAGKPADVEAGSFFRVANWVSTTGPLLKVYLPASVSFKDAQQFATVAAEVRRSPKVSWVSKIEEQVPQVSVYYQNGKWMVESADYPAPQELGAFTAANIIKAAQGPKAQVRALYVELPPAKELVDAVNKKFADYKNLQLVTNASAANYVVYGTVSA